MSESLIDVRIKKGKVVGVVSAEVGELTPKEMTSLREQICVVIAEAEQLYKDNQ